MASGMKRGWVRSRVCRSAEARSRAPTEAAAPIRSSSIIRWRLRAMFSSRCCSYSLICGRGVGLAD